MPTEIISSLHKIQIIGEWHDLWKLKHLMADVKAQGEACFSGWFIPPDGWLAVLLDDGRHPRAYQPCNTVDILTSQSLFSNYFTHYGLRCAQPRLKHSVSWIRVNLMLRTGVLRLILQIKIIQSASAAEFYISISKKVFWLHAFLTLFNLSYCSYAVTSDFGCH